MRRLDRALLSQYALRPIDGGSKETRGRVLVVGGHLRVPGAILLSAEATIRAGAGRLQIGAPAALTTALGIAMPEAMVVAFEDVPSLLDDVDAVIIGPGTFGDTQFHALCAHVARDATCSLLFDAGAFGALRDNNALLHERAQCAVLTPHAGELAQLLGIDREEVLAKPEQSVREAARRFATVTLLKGQTTLVATTQGECFAHDGGTTGLAVCGSGDVLAGIIGGLLSRGEPPLTAALWGIAVHGRAGVLLEERVGLGFLARELPPVVPEIVQEWSSGR